MARYWFKPRIMGKWGMGLPITWQGWGSFLVFAIAVIVLADILGFFNEGASFVSFPQSLMFLSGGIFLSIGFCYLVKDKVEGGVGFWDQDTPKEKTK